MKRTRPALTMRPGGVPVASTFTLLLLLFVLRGALAVCPRACACTRSHRVADCGGRDLERLPDGLQHNIRALNLSRNRLRDLDGLLGHFAHLRALDVSQNQLPRLPAGLPRALWELVASGNLLRLLGKNDTAYQWNLRALDLSANRLERVVFINNTLPALRLLNLSHNRFWTVPTNMPARLETVDLSHNLLRQVLPGSLDQLQCLSRLYLHGNRFAWVGDPPALARLGALRLVTLDGNPWACEDEANITGLLAWARATDARVLGCPCHTREVCGEASGAYAAATGRPHADGANGADGWSSLRPDEGLFFPDANGTANFSLPANHLLFGSGGGGGRSTVSTATATPRSRGKKAGGRGGRANAGLRTCVPDALALNVLLAAVAVVFGGL